LSQQGVNEQKRPVTNTAADGEFPDNEIIGSAHLFRNHPDIIAQFLGDEESSVSLFLF
jgi:hypothetical protein